MSAAFCYPDLPCSSRHKPASVLRTHRELLCSELLAESEQRRMRVLLLGSAGLRDAEPVLANASFSARHSFTVLEEDPWRIEACKQECSHGKVSFVEGLLDEPGFQLAAEYEFIYNLNGLAARNGREAEAWLARVIGLLAPGGRLLMASFTPGWTRLCSEADCAGGWPAFPRTEHQLVALVANMAPECFMGHALWTDESGVLAYLEVVK